MSRRVAAFACAAAAWLLATNALSQHTRDDALSLAFRSNLDNPEQRLVQLRMEIAAAIGEAEPTDSQRELAARKLLELAQLYRNLGMSAEERRTLAQAVESARGTRVENSAAVLVLLARSRWNIENGELVAAWNDYRTVFSLLGPIENPDERLSLSLQREQVGFETLLALADRTARLPPQTVAADLESGLRGMLEAALPGKPLDEQKPWHFALAPLLEGELTRYKEQIEGLSEVQRVPFMSQLFFNAAKFAARIGQSQESVQLMHQSLQGFETFGRYREAMEVWDTLCDFVDVSESPELFRASLDSCLHLLHRTERAAMAMNGASIGPFLKQFTRSYERTYELMKSPGSEETLDLVDTNFGASAGFTLGIPALLQADRMNLRGVRRDMLVQHALRSVQSVKPYFLDRLARQREAVMLRKVDHDLAIQDGKDPSDYLDDPFKTETDPFARYEYAKQELIETLQDVSRSAFDSGLSFSFIPPDWQQLLDGMTPQRAVVMYVEEPGTSRIFAVIMKMAQQGARTPNFTFREIPAEAADMLPKLRQELRDSLAAGIDPSSTLRRLSNLIWTPLGDLPSDLTILLTPRLIGIPFETLPGSSQQPLVLSHTIRYAFGLQPGLGRYPKLESMRKALVTGAADFSASGLAALTSSQDEVVALRRLLQSRGVKVVPKDAMSKTGSAVLAEKGPLDVIHISTHSRLDLTTPLFDSLVFPDDEIFAHDLAVSELKADLVVLSACELFTYRESDLYPVSGITTVAIGRIAPQAISTLWSVNARATRVFMERFYSRLLQTRDPAQALAAAKRDFIAAPASALAGDTGKPKGPEMREQDLEYSKPEYWAAFVLTLGQIDPKD